MVKASVYNVGDWVRSLGWEDALEKGMAIHSRILPGKSHGQRSLVGYSPRGFILPPFCTPGQMLCSIS